MRVLSGRIRWIIRHIKSGHKDGAELGWREEHGTKDGGAGANPTSVFICVAAEGTTGSVRCG